MHSNTVFLADGTLGNTCDLTCGDKLLGIDGNPVGIYSVKYLSNVPIYKISTKGSKPFYVCSSSKILLAKGNKTDVYFVSNFDKDATHKLKGMRNYKTLRNDGTEFNRTYSLPIDPYLFGYLLVNSTITFGSARITISRDVFKGEVEKFANEHNMMLKKINSANKNSNSYQIIGAGKERRRNKLCELFEELELCDVRTPNRFIPDIYKYSSIEDRLQLLAGIFDSSAYKNKNGFQMLTSSKKLADDVVFIAKSVGLTGSRSPKPSIKNGKEYYNICIGGNRNIIPFKVEEKRENAKCNDLLARTFEMEYIGEDDFVYLETSDKYLTEDFIIIA